ncbi:hypothetical protein BJX63DRAFT_416009, partial [Aspergillus granulosus]
EATEGTTTTITECMQPLFGQLPGLLSCAYGDSPGKSWRAGLRDPSFGQLGWIRR